MRRRSSEDSKGKKVVTSRKRSVPLTRLDRLEANGFGGRLARVLRAHYKIITTKGNALSDEQVRRILNQTTHELMLPERATARAAALRYMKISIEHACHVALGHNDPTQQTAKDNGISKKTVNNACSRYPVEFGRDHISQTKARKQLNQYRKERKQLH